MSNPFPRYRGFNLQGQYHAKHNQGTAFEEDHFRWIADWGFDFVRIPTDYRLWSSNADPFIIREEDLAELDRVIDLGQKFGLHICLNLHRAPGYCVNDRDHEEPFSLWKDKEALDAFCLHWTMFARRYKGIDSVRLSFDMVNEPPGVLEEIMTREDHERVMRRTAAEIRAIDPERLIIVDGLWWGRVPCPELADLNVVQSTRAYAPSHVSHYRAAWIPGSDTWDVPAWPADTPNEGFWDRKRLEEHYRPWIDLMNGGTGIHCGEGGFYSKTPHTVGMAWLRDVLEILTGSGIGYALWNFRGSFGILDSGREDVNYKDWHGHKLDEDLLKMLQEF